MTINFEEGGLMATNEVDRNFSNEPNLEADVDRIMAWRSWRVSKIGELRLKIDEMGEDEDFALKWLDIDDVYEALNPEFIETVRLS